MTRSLLTSPCSSEPIVLLQRFCVCSYFWWSGLSFYSLLWNLHVLPNSLRPDATLRCCPGVCCDGSRCCRRRFVLPSTGAASETVCCRECWPELALSVIWWCFLSAGQRAASLRENLSLGVRHESEDLSADQMKHINTLLHILFVAALHTSVLLSRSALPPLWLLKLNEWTSFV